MKEGESQKIHTGVNISEVSISNSKKLFFFGTDEKPGALRVMKYPFTNEILELQAHFGAVTRLRVALKDNFIFTTGEDGALIVYENRDKDYIVKSDNDNVEVVAEEFLIPQDVYNEQKKKIEKLRKELKEERMKQEQQIKEKMKIKDSKISELEAYQKESDTREQAKYQVLEREKNSMIEAYEEKKRLLKLQHENNKRVSARAQSINISNRCLPPDN